MTRLFFVLGLLQTCFAEHLRLGVALPWSGGEWDVAPRFASGITVAVNRINKDPNLLPGFNVTFVWKNSKCNEHAALSSIVDMYTQNHIHAIIGPACSNGCKLGALLASHWNIPIVSYGCAASYLSQSNIYPNFARTVGVYSQSGRVIVKLMMQYDWWRLAIITPTSDIWMDIMNGVRKNVELEGIDVAYFQTFDEYSVTDEFLKKILQNAVKKSHIILIGGYSSTIRKVMRQAMLQNLKTADYAFISYELLLDSCLKSITLQDKEECESVNGMLDISLFVPNDDSYSNFSTLVRNEMRNPPFNHIMSNNEKVENYAAFLHDAAMLYAYALNRTINQNGSVNDGRAIVENMLNLTFNGASGPVHINHVGDRDSSLQLKNVKGTHLERVANYHVDSDWFEMLPNTIIWSGNSTTAPLGRPKCGFNDEYCLKPSLWVYFVVGLFIAMIFLFLVVFFIIRYRQKSLEFSLNSQHWQIRFEDIEFHNGKRKNWRSIIGSNAMLSKCVSNQTLESCIDNYNIFTRIGLFQGNYVAIKRVRKRSVALTRDVLIEIKNVLEIQHQNINPFVGVCVDSPNICVLTKYCNKGSLQDMLFNSDFKLDWIFQISIVSDIARGMQYLHNSSIGVHGNLKSTNCVIDSRWVCKITDFGLSKFKDGQEEEEKVADEEQYYSGLLWTAPEHLDNLKFCRSQLGDVYSYAIIMQEVITKSSPYSMYDTLTSKEIVKLIKRRTIPPFRPVVTDGAYDYLALMRLCWDDCSSLRPQFEYINKVLKKLNGGKNINIVDNMITMMERYTDNLEELVSQRTGLLEEEKTKTNALLYRMLPRTVAEQLKQGSVVKAESYDMVTIFFSDIVGFTKLASESTPLQIVDLLNDLYTCFDTICDKYNVYKVETIGDAYMVVSGLPEHSFNTHAGEIARMSLDLLSATFSFKIKHKSDTKLQLRIGIHSGPVVAGVVGLKMPRYCLFGDTVNYASRMESNGKALHIHVSPECKEILTKLGGFRLIQRGPVTMKGKGTIVTYFLVGYEGFTEILPVYSLN